MITRAGFLLLLIATAFQSHTQAHVGSPDVFLEADAGPYRLLVTVRPPHAIPGVADVIGSRVGVTTQIGDPLGQMKISGRAKSQGVDRDATALLTACGLALRSFD